MSRILLFQTVAGKILFECKHIYVMTKNKKSESHPEGVSRDSKRLLITFLDCRGRKQVLSKKERPGGELGL